MTVDSLAWVADINCLLTGRNDKDSRLQMTSNREFVLCFNLGPVPGVDHLIGSPEEDVLYGILFFILHCPYFY